MKERDNVVFLNGEVQKNPYYGQGQKTSYAFVTIATGSGQYKAYHELKCFGEIADWAKDLTKGIKVWVRGELSYKTTKLPDPARPGKELYFNNAQIVVHEIDIQPLGTGNETSIEEPPF